MMKKRETKIRQFAVCLDNTGYKSSLEIGKLYQVVPDEDAESHGYLRVIDESGEDYAFNSDRFYVVNLPVVVTKALLSAGRS
jgi:hypothetical protein